MCFVCERVCERVCVRCGGKGAAGTCLAALLVQSFMGNQFEHRALGRGRGGEASLLRSDVIGFGGKNEPILCTYTHTHTHTHTHLSVFGCTGSH